MTYVYALFCCFANIHTPCVMIGHEFADPALCIEMKNQYEHSAIGKSEATSEKVVKYICVKQSVPSANRTTQTSGSEG